MGNRKIRNPLEKALIVREIFLAERKGAPKEELTEIRKIIADTLRCSLERVSASGSWGKIRPQNIIKGGLVEKDVKFIRSYVGLAGSGTQQSELQQEMTEIFPMLPMALIRHITMGMRTELDALLTAEAGDAIREIVPASILDATYSPVPLLRGDGGAHTDYNTPRKRKWRQIALRSPIEEFLPTAEVRGTKNALCLAGKECREIDEVLLPLAFSPERIIAVEGGDRIASAQFKLRARERGVDYQAMLLEEFLPQSKTRLHVASIDLAGQLCPTFQEIAGQLLLAERAIVIFNTLARREAGFTQQDLEWLWGQMVSEAEREEKVDAIYRSWSGELPLPPQQTQEWSLGLARELSPLVLVAGMLRKENWGFGGKVSHLPLLEHARNYPINYERARVQENLQTALQPMLRQIITLLSKADVIDRTNINEVKGVIGMDRMFYDVIFGNKYISKLRKFVYDSDWSTGNLVYHTDIAVIHTPLGLYQDHEVKNATEFLLQCVSDAIRCMHENPEPEPLAHYSFSLMRNDFLIDPTEAKKSDYLVCLRDGKIVQGGKKPVHTLLNAARKHHEYRSREGNYGNLRKQLEEPRMRIVD